MTIIGQTIICLLLTFLGSLMVIANGFLAAMVFFACAVICIANVIQLCKEVSDTSCSNSLSLQ